MKKLIRSILSYFRLSVYVVQAYDSTTGKMKECRVYSDIAEASKEFDALKKVYTGNDSVIVFSREILPKFEEYNN